MKKLFLYSLLILILGTFASIPSLLIFWANEPSPILYSSRKILNPKVYPGEQLKIEVKSEVAKSSCISTVYRSIVDSGEAVYEIDPASLPPSPGFIVEITVPLRTIPGPAKYRAKVEWICNPVQRYFPLIVLQPEVDFEILKKEEHVYITSDQIEQLRKSQLLLDHPVPPGDGTVPINRTQGDK